VPTVANKDVNLTITAKNAATKTILSVNSALKELKKSQTDANRASGSGASVISKLSTEYSTLVGQAKKLRAAADVSGSINKASSAVKRLSDSAKIASANQKLLEQDLKSSKVVTAELAAQQKKLSTAYDTQKAKLVEAKAARAGLRKELTLEENLYKRIATAASKSNQTSFSRPAAQSAFVFQADGVGDQRLELSKTQRVVDELTASMKTLKSTQTDVNTSAKQAGAAEAALVRDFAALNSVVERNNIALAQGRTELGKIQTVARQGGIAALAADQEKLEASTREVVAEMEKMERVNAALNKFSDGGGSFTDPKAAALLQAQRIEVDKARASYELLNAEYTRLSSTSRATLAPQSNAAKAAREVGVAAKVAEAELNKQIAALNRLPGAAKNIRGAMGGIYSNYNSTGRTALSLTQRIRAEVIGLALAYGGLHEALRLMKEVVSAYRTLEAAQNRLMVVMQGDARATADELSFLERQAARLGVDFGVLADEYSKFAVASNAANFSGESTRKVFLNMAEAGRVNKLSTEQMSGVFLALTQIMSKGKFSAEEVTRQLGDRLPGAANILAEALYGSADAVDTLFDEMRKGNVLATEENLLKFADTLKKKFGPQLGESLRTTTTLIGQFTNELFQAKLRIGEGGFIDALNVALKEMITYFKSREGRDFFLGIGAAMGQLVSFLPIVIQNFDTIMVLVRTFVSFKLAQWFVNSGKAVLGMVAGLKLARGSLIGTTASMRTAQGAMASLSIGAKGLRVALLAIPGGLAIAALTTVVSALLGRWTSGIGEVNSSIDEHTRIMSVILTAYEEAKGKAGEWRDALPNDIGLPEVEQNYLRQFDRMVAGIVKTSQAGNSAINRMFYDPRYGQGRREFSAQLEAMTDEFNDTHDIKAYHKALSEFSKELTDLDARQLIFDLIDLASETAKATNDLGQAATAATEMGSKIEDLDNVTARYGRTLDDMTSAIKRELTEREQAAVNAERYDELMGQVGKTIESVADEMEYMADSDALGEMLTELLKVAKTADEIAAAMQLAARAQEELDLTFRGSPSAGSYETKFANRAGTTSGRNDEELVRAVTLLADKMGLAAEDILTAISYETAGTFSPTVGTDNVTSQGMHFGLIQWGDGPGAAGERYGITRESGITEQVEAAGKYLADAGVQAGDGLKRIYAAINTGTANGGNRSDTASGGAPGTANDKVNDQMDDHRAQAEGMLAAYSGVTTAIEATLTAEEDAAEEAKKRREEAEETAADGRTNTAESIADTAFAITQQDLINGGRERQAAIEEAIRSAKADDANITETELASIVAQTGALYDKENALSAEETRKKAIAEVDKKLNDLEAQRNALIEKRDLQKEQGNAAGALETDAEITAIALSLDEAYLAAIKFWEALGGPGAAASIAKLEAASLGLDELKAKVIITGEEINNQLADGLANSFQSFAEAIANGENAVDAFWQSFRKFAADFLIQIGTMILKQLFLNALTAAFGGATGGVGGVIAGGIASIFHEGGVAGESAPSRAVSPSWFNNATRYHTGGIAGLKANEVPAILEKNEEILPENDPRHRDNAGAKSGKRPLRIVNAIDGLALLESAFANAGSDELIVNKIRDLKDDIRPAIGV
jgi:tape measure domain-containing protein